MSVKQEKTGVCLCGAVKITALAASKKFGACHCSMCRKWVGGPLMAVDCGSDVRIEGEENITVYASSEWADRGFCRVCGSSLFYRLKSGSRYHIPLGLFTDVDNMVFSYQVFHEEKPACYDFLNETRIITAAEIFERLDTSS